MSAFYDVLPGFGYIYKRHPHPIGCMKIRRNLPAIQNDL